MTPLALPPRTRPGESPLQCMDRADRRTEMRRVLHMQRHHRIRCCRSRVRLLENPPLLLPPALPRVALATVWWPKARREDQWGSIHRVFAPNAQAHPTGRLVVGVRCLLRCSAARIGAPNATWSCCRRCASLHAAAARCTPGKRTMASRQPLSQRWWENAREREHCDECGHGADLHLRQWRGLRRGRHHDSLQRDTHQA
jgi:hypothetical protein